MTMTVTDPAPNCRGARGREFPTRRWIAPARAVATAAAAVAVVAGSAPAHAQPLDPLASAFEPDDPFDVHASLRYRFDIHTTAVKRELAGLDGTDPNGPTPLAKDLRHSSLRHEVVPRLDIGLFRDLSLSVELPVVIRDTRELEFDQSGDPCVFSGSGQAPTCINADNSTTVQDGLLPESGFDSGDANGPGFGTGDATIFRGPTRAGLDQIHLGLQWAPMNQLRDPWKPTWKLGGQVRVAVGEPMRFDRSDPNGATGVGRGVHEIRLWSSVEKRMSWAAPYFEFWWMAPIGTRDDSQFIEPGYGQTRVSPQQRAGTRFGLEAFAWESPDGSQRVGIDLHSKIETFFEGRNYTEMWEILQYAGDPDAGGPLVLDGDPTTTGQQALAHPGVTNVENYMRIGGGAAVRAVLGEKVRFDAGFDLAHDQAHSITYADAGIDSSDGNQVVDPGTDEVNPLYAPTVDQVGHRYRTDGSLDYIITLSGRVLF